MKWSELHELRDLKEICELLEQDEDTKQLKAFQCSIGLNKLPDSTLVLFLLGMNTNKIKSFIEEEAENVTSSFTRTAEYLYNRMTEDSLQELSEVLILASIASALD